MPKLGHTLHQTTSKTTFLNNSDFNSTNMLAAFMRYYIGDFMTLQPGGTTLLLTVSNSNITRTVEPKAIVQFGTTSFNLYNAIVTSSPQSQLTINGVPSSDLKHGLHVGNHGNYIKVFNDSDSSQKDNESSFLAWREVVLSRNIGTQARRRINKIRDMCDIFKSRKKNKRRAIACFEHTFL